MNEKNVNKKKHVFQTAKEVETWFILKSKVYVRLKFLNLKANVRNTT